MNKAFGWYLSTFVNIYVYGAAVLIYGLLKVWWQNDPTKNLMFPLCGMRCGYEASVLLAQMGSFAQSSQEFKRVTKGLMPSPEKREYTRAITKSQRPVKCRAGCYGWRYDFDKSLLVSSFDHGVQFLVDLLCTFP